MNTSRSERILQALTEFRIEIPSWGFANTGTRFGKFVQAAAATTTEEKFSDAGQVHLLTGICPSVALHVLWDFPEGVNSIDEVHKLSERFGVQAGSINPKLFEPAFYHTDIADWGMALHFARFAGPQAKVLVDTGHHYAAQNIEQIVAWLLSEGMLGGFHFNDRRYADDDLTLGSIDPYQVFRIFHEIHFFAADRRRRPDIAYMIDQSHNEKPKIEATIQTVVMAQELYAKAALVDHDALRRG